MRRLLFPLPAFLALLGPACALDVGGATLGLERTGACRALAVRDLTVPDPSASDAFVTIGCLDAAERAFRLGAPIMDAITMPAPFGFRARQDNLAFDPETQGSLFLFRPTLSTAGHQNAMYIHPQIPPAGTMTDPNVFFSAYAVYHGISGTPIPAGSKGVLGGFECNINTAQTEADSIEGHHCFGATIQSFGSAPISGSAIVMRNYTAESDMTGHTIQIENFTPMAKKFPRAFKAAAAGPHASHAAYEALGSWNYGFIYGNFNVRKDGPGHYFLSADGFTAKAGMDGPSTGNVFNVHWNGSQADLWIDNVNTGRIVTADPSGRMAVAGIRTRTGTTGSFGADAYNFSWSGTDLEAHINAASAGFLERRVAAPRTSSEACAVGVRAFDANYEYRCVATNTWKRASLSSW